MTSTACSSGPSHQALCPCPPLVQPRRRRRGRCLPCRAWSRRLLEALTTVTTRVGWAGGSAAACARAAASCSQRGQQPCPRVQPHCLLTGTNVERVALAGACCPISFIPQPRLPSCRFGWLPPFCIAEEVLRPGNLRTFSDAGEHCQRAALEAWVLARWGTFNPLNQLVHVLQPCHNRPAAMPQRKHQARLPSSALHLLLKDIKI